MPWALQACACCKAGEVSDAYTASVEDSRQTAEVVTVQPACDTLGGQLKYESSCVCHLTPRARAGRSQDGQHAVAYELGWRTLSDPSRRASLPVRQQLGDHLKSAVSYAVHRDEREPGEDGFYTSGSLLR